MTASRSNPFLPLGAVLALLAVGAGAFGAHGLRRELEPRMLEVFETAVQYQMYHAFGLMVIGLLIRQQGARRALSVAGWSMFGGILVFSGSLYCLSVFNIPRLGMITPVGGVAFMVGWLALAIGATRSGT